MVQQMKNYLKQGWQLFKDSVQYFGKGLKENLFKEYFYAFVTCLSANLGKFHFQLGAMRCDHKKNFLTIYQRVKGLHSLLPEAENFHYSILIHCNQPTPKLFESCLESACMQTAPNLEILIGSKVSFTSEVLRLIHDIQTKYPDTIQLFDFSHANNTDTLHNLLAQQSRGNYLVFIEQDDWIRPDLLYRYEQYLRTVSVPEKTVINCNENLININEHFIPGTATKKNKIFAPYIFDRPFDLRGLLIPKRLWKDVKGVRKKFSSAGAGVEDLLLRLDLAGASFANIPFCLYSRRLNPKARQRNPDLPMFIESLKEYAKNKGLNWTFEQGYLPNTVRAIPQNIRPHKVRIIVPYKDQKDLTLSCIESILRQTCVDYHITAVDNGSVDTSIAEAIRDLGGEVLRIEEPFNFSRLNNLAAASTQSATDCDLILFLNNDVELDENALEEMLRWIDQPSIGMVGARLHYPNGQLQHGGIVLNKHELPEYLWWDHVEKTKSFAEMKETKKHAVVDAVTAACALIKKDVFLQLGGFDEIWYPIGFSDTTLAVKLNNAGLKCFYTPYAFGVHHESISRKESLEDIEASRWLHELTQTIER